MTLKRNMDGQQVVVFGLAEKAIFGTVSALITAGIIALISMAMDTKADIASIKERTNAIDRRVERLEDGK